jgi:hypothetical protein
VRVDKQRNGSGRNRKRVNVPRRVLLWASAVLAVECVAALLFSPRLWVRRIIVEGNRVVPAPSIVQRMALGDHTNLIRLPTRRLRSVILAAEPRIGDVEIHRRLPDTVRVVVTERMPWACAQIADGSCYIIDRDLVPFEAADVPPVGLPLLKLSQATVRPALGKPLTEPGLDQVSGCLAWARSRPDFPLDAVSIDADGKLCLNRAGGAIVQLGSARDLDKKLRSLELLLGRRPELRDPARVAYVNLFAYDAPAVYMKPAEPAGVSVTPGRHHHRHDAGAPAPTADGDDDAADAKAADTPKIRPSASPSDPDRSDAAADSPAGSAGNSNRAAGGPARDAAAGSPRTAAAAPDAAVPSVVPSSDPKASP